MKKIAFIPILIILGVLWGCSFRDSSASSEGVLTNKIETDQEMVDRWKSETAIERPVITFIKPSANQSIYGVFNMQLVVVDNTASPSTTLKIAGNLVSLTTGTASNTTDTNGKTSYFQYYSYDIVTTNMFDGYHSALAIATDSDGYASTNGITIIIDNLSRITGRYPSALITNLTNLRMTTNNSLQFIGHASVSIGTITNIQLIVSNSGATITSNIAVSNNSLVWSNTVNLASILEGTFYAKVIAHSTNSDGGTNNSYSAGWMTLKKDTSAPTINFNTTTYTTNTRMFYYSAKGTNTDAVGIYRVYTTLSNKDGIFYNIFSGGGATNLPWEDFIHIKSGENRYTVYAVDMAGFHSTTNTKILNGGNDIIIDGNLDFEEGSRFLTTSSGYYTYVAWDANNLYVAFEGEDISKNSSDYVISIYLSTNTNDKVYGNPISVGYNGGTMKNVLPFFAHYHIGFPVGITNWSTTNLLTNALDIWKNCFNFTGSIIKNGNYLEMNIPLSNIGKHRYYYLTSAMIVQNSGLWNYAGLYHDNFTDANSVDYSKFLAIDTNLKCHEVNPTNLAYKQSGTTSLSTPHSILLDGINNFWTNERFTATDSKTVYFTWDATKLYFGFESQNMTVDKQTFYVVISTNTNIGTNVLPYGQFFEGSTVNLPLKAQFLFYFKRWSGTEEKYRRVWDGSAWDNSGHAQNSTGVASWFTTTYNELSINRSEIGNPSGKIYIMTYLKDLSANSDWGWLYGSCPLDSVAGGLNDKTLTKWIEVTLSDGVTPNDPTHIKP